MLGKEMVGVGRVVITKRERAIILEPIGKGLRGMTLRYAYEVRKEDEYFADIPDVKVARDMLKLAEHIVDTKTASSSRPRSSTTTSRRSSTWSRRSRRPPLAKERREGRRRTSST